MVGPEFESTAILGKEERLKAIKSLLSGQLAKEQVPSVIEAIEKSWRFEGEVALTDIETIEVDQ